MDRRDGKNRIDLEPGSFSHCRFHKLQNVFKHHPQIDWMQRERFMAAIGGQLQAKSRPLFRRRLDILQRLGSRQGFGRAHPRERRIAKDGRQQVIEFMSDSYCQGAQTGQPLSFQCALFKL